MKEITRIHIAKTAYDIEIAAKKELEKYIKSLETYTQDAEVLMDIEIRITELLNERNVGAGKVITSDDVAAVRKQLGEPYEFANDEGDMAIGTESEPGSRRLYRSPDDAVLGGVLSGIAAYFNVNPLWVRLVFVLLLCISFGFAAFIYIIFWIIIPPARTAAERLRLAGKDVTLESIRELNVEEEAARPNRVAPVLQQALSLGFGSLSLLMAVAVFTATIWITIAALTFSPEFADITNGFTGLGDGNSWIVWLTFWIVIFGLTLLGSLFGLVSYAFFTKKITKKLFISCVVIVVLGLSSAAAAVGISASQSWRVANETRSMVNETKANLPEEFKQVKKVTFNTVSVKTNSSMPDYFGNNATVRYIVDNGPARYELSALPNVKASTIVNDAEATITLTVPESYRNSFVQPLLTVYGPAVETVVNKSRELSYVGMSQDSLTIVSELNKNVHVDGGYERVVVSGAGFVELGSSAVLSLDVQSNHDLKVNAGTVRELNVVQPDVCPAGTYRDATNVTVSSVTTKQITYNGNVMPAQTYRTSCASVVIGENEEYGEE